MADVLESVVLNPGVGGAKVAAEAVPDNVASTTIAAGSNLAVLPQGTINVVSTAGFPAVGIALVQTSAAGLQLVAYTGITGTTLTGCTGGTGTMSTGGTVASAALAEVVKLITGADGVNGGFVAPTNPLDVRIGDANAQATVFPAGFFRTSDEPRQLLYDPFDGSTIDTSNWNAPVSAGGGVAAAVGIGSLTIGTGTTALGYAYLQSVNSFRLVVPGWLGVSSFLKTENPVTANTYRFWGQGTVPATPAASSSTVAGASLVNGVGWEVGTDGKLLAVVWNNGVRTIVQDFSASGNNKQPTDGGFHRYILYVRTDKIFWYIDGLGVPVASASFINPQIQTLPDLFLAVAGAVAPTVSGVLNVGGTANWDTAKNNTTLSDGTYGWRKATVKPATVPATATDTSLLVANPMVPNQFDIRYDLTSDPLAFYIGYAPLGSTAAGAVWTIKKIALVAGSPTSVTWSSVGNIIWNNRAAATYT